MALYKLMRNMWLYFFNGHMSHTFPLSVSGIRNRVQISWNEIAAVAHQATTNSLGTYQLDTNEFSDLQTVHTCAVTSVVTYDLKS